MTLSILETEEIDIPKEGITILDFFADWCGPCKMMDPILKELAEGDINVIKINTDTLPKLSAKFQISSIPSMFIYKDGRPGGKGKELVCPF